jgi:hypothetical protein
MLARILMIASVLYLVASPAYAKIWQVSNDPRWPAQFTTLQEAHDAAASGDTVHVAGSSSTYAPIRLQKKLCIFGPGYFLAENDSTQARKLTAEVHFAQYDTLGFDEASAGSAVWGLFLNLDYYGIIDVDADSVLLGGCYIKGTEQYIGIHVGDDHSVTDFSLKRNYVLDTAGYSGESDFIVVSADCQRARIHSNYLGRTNTIREWVFGGMDGEFLNNVMLGNFIVQDYVVMNNILISGNLAVGEGALTYNNLANQSQFGTDRGNQAGVDMATVFIGPQDGSTDGQWKLKEGSPAIGAGYQGASDQPVDAGMFGGGTPYLLSGVPPLPAIYEANIAPIGSPTDGLPVEVKVRGHN